MIEVTGIRDATDATWPPMLLHCDGCGGMWIKHTLRAMELDGETWRLSWGCGTCGTRQTHGAVDAADGVSAARASVKQNTDAAPGLISIVKQIATRVTQGRARLRNGAPASAAGHQDGQTQDDVQR